VWLIRDGGGNAIGFTAVEKYSRISVAMTSYDRYRGYARSPPCYYQFHHRQHLRHHQLQQLDETGATPAWTTSVERAPADDGRCTAGRQQAASPSPAAVQGGDGAPRHRPPPFTIDAILSGTGNATTGSGLTVLTSGAEWSTAAQQTTASTTGSQLDAAIQLTRGKPDKKIGTDNSVRCVGDRPARVERN